MVEGTLNLNLPRECNNVNHKIMLNIKIVTIGRIKEADFQTMEGEYLKRLKPYAKIEISELKAESFTDSTRLKAKSAEGERLLAALASYSKSQVWLLTEFGQEFDSIGFSELMKKSFQEPLVLVLAGTLGFDQAVLEAYSNHLALSKLTFTHEMARVILLEQVYRSATIINDKSYHY